MTPTYRPSSAGIGLIAKDYGIQPCECCQQPHHKLSASHKFCAACRIRRDAELRARNKRKERERREGKRV